MAAPVTITVQLDPHVFHTLQDYAASTGRTEAHAAADLIGRYLDVHPRQQVPGQADAAAAVEAAPRQQQPRQSAKPQPSAFASQGAQQQQQQQDSQAAADDAQQQQQQQHAQEASARSLSSEWSLGRLDSRGVSALRQQQSLVPLYVAAPIIRLVDGLLAGDHSVADCLAKGNFGIGTLNYLDGEVVILDGVAYHQGTHGTTRLTGQERTPFMTVTTFNQSWCREFVLPPMSDLASLEAHLRGLFRSKNVIYALLIKGCFPHLRCRSVAKQEGNVRLAEVAKSQVTFDYADEASGHLIGFFTPEFVGSSLSVPGFHFHFLSGDKQRGGHLLGVELSQGKVLLQEIHRTQVDLPFEADWMGSSLDMGRLDAELSAAERERS